MTRQEERVRAILKLRRLKRMMVIGYGVIVAIAVIGVTLFSTWENQRIFSSKIRSMSANLNVQMKLNLDNYLARMERIGTLAFSIDEAYTYDATDDSNDEYNAIKTEKAISEQLLSLCLMENFVDYGIVYRNNHTIGKISNGTTELFGNALYEGLEGMISRERTHDGWHTGYNDDYTRIYYVKRIHENAVLVLSFYTMELERLFDNPETFEYMTVRLADDSSRVVYSSDKEDILGGSLPTYMMRYTTSSVTGSLIDANHLVSIDPCEVGWYIISTIPTDIVMRERNQSLIYIYIAAGVATLLAVLAGWLFSNKVSDPISMIALNLSADDLEDDEEAQ